ncbi:MAG TPA: hypothetical protein VN112_05655 [Ensifer sp.]|jgi:hypothetical protein|nr:hypothetical protein [Ensifer sp.]
MAYFKSKTIRGQVYDLDHLDPFDFDIEVEGVTIVVHVEFTCHCFTEALKQEHTPDLRYAHGKETRAFDIQRYELSKKLPEMLRTLGTRSVYHTQQGSFFVLRDEDIEGLKVPYLVFFSAFKATDKRVHVQLLVRSAYLKPGMAEFAAPVRFSTLMRFTRDGKTPPMGPRKQLKRK